MYSRQDPRRVFIGHSDTDALLAARLAGAMRTRHGPDLEVVTSDDYPHDADWLDVVAAAIAASDAFVLLMNRPARGTDWRLFEAGLFGAAPRGSVHLCCLRRSGARAPIQLAGARSIVFGCEEPAGLAARLDVVCLPQAGVRLRLVN